MAFVVGDVVTKVDGTQKYEVMEVLEESKYTCKYYPRPPYSNIVSFTFKESEIELAN